MACAMLMYAAPRSIRPPALPTLCTRCWRWLFAWPTIWWLILRQATFGQLFLPAQSRGEIPRCVPMFEKIALPGSGRETTRLGFGGSGLMGGLSERESLALLETAYDAGIRHFDVAPVYGHGQAERCLGIFLRGKTDKVTIATKYGILPPQCTGLLGVARSIVRPVVRRLPAIRKRVAQAAAGLAAKASFSVDEAQRSLDRSLQQLGIDRIDVWLL